MDKRFNRSKVAESIGKTISWFFLFKKIKSHHQLDEFQAVYAGLTLFGELLNHPQ